MKKERHPGFSASFFFLVFFSKNLNANEGASAISAPGLFGPHYFSCGITYDKPLYKLNYNNETVNIYYLNKTAERLSSEGYNISSEVVQNDFLMSFASSNGTDEERFYQAEGYSAVSSISFWENDEPPEIIRANYMAQIGEKKGENITWHCDGVLINWHWVLSTAHCFLNLSSLPNVIRLGQYNTSEPVEEDIKDVFARHLYDFEIAQIVRHPLFDVNHGYHDLVLLRLSRKAPMYTLNINPACLPWDNKTNEDLSAKKLILTGWEKATEYDGGKTDVLQKVRLEALNVSRCEESYSQSPKFKTKYPHGMTEETVLCVGWKEDGRHDCVGDFGAPLVYDDIKQLEISVVGILSGGYGCRRKEFPGLYVPINKPQYLSWIKDVAFKDIYQ